MWPSRIPFRCKSRPLICYQRRKCHKSPDQATLRADKEDQNPRTGKTTALGSIHNRYSAGIPIHFGDNWNPLCIASWSCCCCCCRCCWMSFPAARSRWMSLILAGATWWWAGSFPRKSLCRRTDQMKSSTFRAKSQPARIGRPRKRKKYRRRRNCCWVQA